jgi:hypothetical protein
MRQTLIERVLIFTLYNFPLDLQNIYKDLLRLENKLKSNFQNN